MILVSDGQPPLRGGDDLFLLSLWWLVAGIRPSALAMALSVAQRLLPLLFGFSDPAPGVAA